MTDHTETAREVMDYVQRPPRGLAHDMLATIGIGCPGFHGDEHSKACDRLTQTLIDYGRWREFKAERRGMVRAAEIAREREVYWNSVAYDKRQAGQDDSFACASAQGCWDVAAAIEQAAKVGGK